MLHSLAIVFSFFPFYCFKNHPWFDPFAWSLISCSKTKLLCMAIEMVRCVNWSLYTLGCLEILSIKQSVLTFPIFQTSPCSSTSLIPLILNRWLLNSFLETLESSGRSYSILGPHHYKLNLYIYSTLTPPSFNIFLCPLNTHIRRFQTHSMPHQHY